MKHLVPIIFTNFLHLVVEAVIRLSNPIHIHIIQSFAAKKKKIFMNIWLPCNKLQG